MSSQSDLTFQDVLSILRLIDSAPFQDIEVEFEGTRLKVIRRAAARPAQAASIPVAAAQAGKPQAEEKPRQGSRVGFRNSVEVKPPMAGTFYSAPSPGAPAFVEVDRSVRKGDQLGVVEVMKLFTPVVSPCDGTVRAILVKNQDFVENDQTLMIVEAV